MTQLAIIMILVGASFLIIVDGLGRRGKQVAAALVVGGAALIVWPRLEKRCVCDPVAEPVAPSKDRAVCYALESEIRAFRRDTQLADARWIVWERGLEPTIAAVLPVCVERPATCDPYLHLPRDFDEALLDERLGYLRLGLVFGERCGT